MKPTPRALELVDPLRQLLRQVERVLESDTAFDPETTQRTFTIRMSDILACMLLPQLVAKGRASPGIGFSTCCICRRRRPSMPWSATKSTLPSAWAWTFERDPLSQAAARPHGVHHAKVASDRAKEDHRFDDFIGQEHMKVWMSSTDLRFVDAVLGELGYERKIVLNVPHWLVVPHVLKQTNLLAVMPGHLATTLMDNDLRMFDVPFKSEPFSWMMYWHRRYDQSNANCWLRDHVQRVCGTLT